MALLRAQINGAWYDLPTPAPENYAYQNIHVEKSSRNATGYLHRDIVRRNVPKVLCGFNYLTAAETSLLETLYGLDYFNLECTNNHNQRVIIRVYAGPLDAKAITMNRNTYQIIGRTNSQINFIGY